MYFISCLFYSKAINIFGSGLGPMWLEHICHIPVKYFPHSVSRPNDRKPQNKKSIHLTSTDLAILILLLQISNNEAGLASFPRPTN